VLLKEHMAMALHRKQSKGKESSCVVNQTCELSWAVQKALILEEEGQSGAQVNKIKCMKNSVKQELDKLLIPSFQQMTSIVITGSVKLFVDICAAYSANAAFLTNVMCQKRKS
jgi:hypothetical protein